MKAAIDWFINNYVQANPSKFQFMFLKHFRCKEDIPDSIEIDSITNTHQSDVKYLGMAIDDKLRFNKHNVMYRFKNIFDMKEQEKIYNTFILANFSDCSTIWHLCGKTCIKKIERKHECALRFMFNDHCSTYPALLEKCNYKTLHV